MATTVGDTAPGSFTIEHASGLHAVARKLDELHQRSIRSLIDDESMTTGAPVLNLVAVCISVDDADLASQTVGFLSQTHPTRAIVIFADPDANARIEADISLQNGNGENEVTAEQVRLNVHGPAAYHLASVVTPLLVPDIPVYLWLVGAPPPQQAFGDDAVAISERIVIDTGEYSDAQQILAKLSSEIGTESRTFGLTDIAWHRSRIWREMLAQAFDGPEMRPFVHRITRVEVHCAGMKPSTQAWLIGGWMADRLDWADHKGPYFDARAELSDLPSNDLTRIKVTCIGREHNAMVTVQRNGDSLTTAVEIDGGIAASQTFTMRDPDMAHLVASLLEEGSNDPTYVAALHRAAKITPARKRK